MSKCTRQWARSESSKRAIPEKYTIVVVNEISLNAKELLQTVSYGCWLLGPMYVTFGISGSASVARSPSASYIISPTASVVRVCAVIGFPVELSVKAHLSTASTITSRSRCAFHQWARMLRSRYVEQSEWPYKFQWRWQAATWQGLF